MWFLDNAYDWHYLAPGFTAYLRMMFFHFGFPRWQATLTPYGPTLRIKVGAMFVQWSII